MKFWDYVAPHRMILNAVLRKSSQQLREEVGRYQVEYDKKLKEVEVELEKEENAINKKLESAKDSFTQMLKEEATSLTDLRDKVIDYIRKHQYYRSNAQLIKIYKSRREILREDISFLSEQIRLINEEIGILNGRIEQLNAFVNVDDIVRLAQENGYDLGVSSDARTLLISVSNKIQNCDNSYERYALIRLKNIIQERSEYLSTINYISWTIHSKKEFSKQLSVRRRSAKTDLKKTTDIISKLYAEKESFDKDIEVMARDIRMYWARPIAFINADICYLKNLRSELEDEKQQKIDSRREVCDELHHLASMHSDDEYRWDRLQREREQLSSDIDELKDRISHAKRDLSEKKTEVSYWYDLRKQICQVCWDNKSTLKSDKNNIPNDEEIILNERLEELNAIRNQGVIDAKRVCDEKRSEINSDYEQQISEINSLMLIRDSELKAANNKLEELKKKLDSSRRILELSKKNDNRNFFAKLLSDTQEVSRAKMVIAMDKQAIAVAESELTQVMGSVNALNSQRATIDKAHQEKLALCMPVYLRPTDTEKLEEKKILLRIEEISDKRNKVNADES